MAKGTTLLVLVLVLLGACSTPPAKPKPVVDAGPADAADATVDVPVDVPPAPELVEDIAPDLGQPEDVPPDTVADSEPDIAVDTSECSTATDCADLLTLQPCQVAVCDAGQCKAAKQPDACCSDADCDDKFECTADKCDLTTHQCASTAIINCCSGKVTLLKTGFEQGNFEADFKDTPGVSNGNVAWQLSGNRAHAGKHALYFGNECHVYNTTATQDDGCKPATEAAAVATVLATQAFALPKDKKVQLHFWLWLDAEPLYTTSLKAGDCKNPCPTGASCVLVAGASQCLPEKDVLAVNVLFGDKVLPVFNSTAIGKTTKGGWQHIAIDLSTWAGQLVKLQWAFNTGTGLKNDFEGIYLDDVVVETICAQGGALCNTKTACVDDSNSCTVDGCSEYANAAGNGVCFFDKVPGCCATAGDCDDADVCTTESCVAGTCQSAPDTTKAGCCKPDVMVADDFDGGALDAWTSLSQNSVSIKWRIDGKGGLDQASGKIGSPGLYFGSEQFSGYDDPALGKDVGPKGMLCTKSFKLKQGTLYDLVYFDLMLETEWSGQAKTAYKNPPIAGKAKFDDFTVQVYSAGNFTEVWNSDAVFGTTDGKYKGVTVALDAFQGKTVQVCLAFDSGDGQQNNYGGVHVDNFVVKAACSKKACYFDNECAASKCPACQAATCTDTGCTCGKIANCCKVDLDCNDGDDKCTADSCGSDSVCIYKPTGADGCAK